MERQNLEMMLLFWRWKLPTFNPSNGACVETTLCLFTRFEFAAGFKPYSGSSASDSSFELTKPVLSFNQYHKKVTTHCDMSLNRSKLLPFKQAADHRSHYQPLL